jgi:hypothetical protein
MSPLLYAVSSRLFPILACVGVGTNLGLYQIFFVLLSGRLLASRGALFPALCDSGLAPEAVRRSVAALAYGKWSIADLITAWRKCVFQERHFRRHEYEGYHPVPCDLVGFFRPHLQGQVGKHYTSQAEKALPAMVWGMVADVGSVGKKRLPLLRRLVRQQAGESEVAFQARLLQETARTLKKDELFVTDAGFSLADCLLCEGAGFVIRLDQNATARKNVLPLYKGCGARPKFGEVVRPLARTYRGKELAGTPPDKTARWKVGEKWVRAHIFEDLVLPDQKPGSATFRIVVIFDPRYKKPLVLATNKPLTAYALWCIYADRWPVEQMPLAAKQMLGGERSFVHNDQSRWRLPELAMLAGNLLSYVAACGQPVATGFWDRAAQPTCGRVRRLLARLHFSDLPLLSGQVRKKDSPTAHLPKGIAAHRRRTRYPKADKQAANT